MPLQWEESQVDRYDLAGRKEIAALRVRGHLGPVTVKSDPHEQVITAHLALIGAHCD